MMAFLFYVLITDALMAVLVYFFPRIDPEGEMEKTLKDFNINPIIYYIFIIIMGFVYLPATVLIALYRTIKRLRREKHE